MKALYLRLKVKRGIDLFCLRNVGREYNLGVGELAFGIRNYVEVTGANALVNVYRVQTFLYVTSMLL